MVGRYEDGYKDGINHTLKIMKKLMEQDGITDIDKYYLKLKRI